MCAGETSKRLVVFLPGGARALGDVGTQRQLTTTFPHERCSADASAGGCFFFLRARECVFIHVCVPVFIVAYHNIIDQAGSQTNEGFLFSRGDILGHYEHLVYVLWCVCVCV